MMRTSTLGIIYKYLAKPFLFKQDAEDVHDSFITYGVNMNKSKISKGALSFLLNYKSSKLPQEISGINFSNPIGLAAGFDYNGKVAEILQDVGFGFNTVGTVTAKPYEGNKPPRLVRLPESQSILVNKGFKSDGVDLIEKTLDAQSLDDHTVGVSIGSSNIPEVNTIQAAIDDYIYSFDKLKDKKYIKYFELNISCPNAAMSEGFGKKAHLEPLLDEVIDLDIKKPIFIKMANELPLNETDRLVHLGIDKGAKGFIFSNLVKSRENRGLRKSEINKITNLKGNFSGKPTLENSNRLIKHIYREYGNDTLIIGCGGIFSAEDAYKKIKLGASLVQLITGMVYQGPQLISQINEGLVDLFKKDRYDHISEAIGADA